MSINLLLPLLPCLLLSERFIGPALTIDSRQQRHQCLVPEDREILNLADQPLKPNGAINPLHHQSLNRAMSSKAVDQAFQRLYGYAWGSKVTVDNNLPQELIAVFGSKDKVLRILRLPSIGGTQKPTPKDAAMLLTKRILTTSDKKRKGFTATTNAKQNQQSFKRRKISAADYKDIELPEDVVAAKAAIEETPAAATTAPSVVKKPTSKLDSVLQQIAGQKKQNTVEKTSNDWETFKEQDKQLQDELELQAQSKNAYLVKQDFLTRVDQRRFEIEKEERDQERSKRQLAQAAAKK